MHDLLPKMLSGDELMAALTVLPPYDSAIQNAESVTRLLELSKLYQIYIPSDMSMEIYSKVYLSILRSIQKKQTKAAVRQGYENNIQMKSGISRGIIGGSDSYTIIGTSGIGKSSAIFRVIEVMEADKLIKDNEASILPALVVQCPHDCSVKGLLLEILRLIDEHIGTKHLEQAKKARATTDMLIGAVSQTLLNHVGLLVVDEIQNVVNSRHGRDLVATLTQLINNSGISICMVGTPESEKFFEQEMQLARRALGLKYVARECDDYFRMFCEIVFSYQFTAIRTDFSEALCRWFYEHSGGILSMVIAIYYDAQEVAILSGVEEITIELLDDVYTKRFQMMNPYIEAKKVEHSKPRKTDASPVINEDKSGAIASAIETHNFNLEELLMEAKKEKADPVEQIKAYVEVVEVPV